MTIDQQLLSLYGKQLENHIEKYCEAGIPSNYQLCHRSTYLPILIGGVTCPPNEGHHQWIMYVTFSLFILNLLRPGALSLPPGLFPYGAGIFP